MLPNLMLIAKKAFIPGAWLKSNKSKTKNVRKLYFSREPVPGVYAMTPDRNCYLVALRPNRKKDDEHIFRKLTSKEDICLKSTEGLNELNETSRINFNEDGTKNILQFAYTKRDGTSGNLSMANTE
ncbi:hypothetical protein EG329_004291 [Mollisiaceae sp. DMI_Dod_QoI]|nr:hypothetical protein EG329_004291 [Helotiales sp. DMI_Dod_QoI]